MIVNRWNGNGVDTRLPTSPAALRINSRDHVVDGSPWATNPGTRDYTMYVRNVNSDTNGKTRVSTNNVPKITSSMPDLDGTQSGMHCESLGKTECSPKFADKIIQLNLRFRWKSGNNGNNCGYKCQIKLNAADKLRDDQISIWWVRTTGVTMADET